ncbi:MAG TPA: hypothetical protein HA362_01160 [Nanoarchaeota archaeon]|nr:hypothetical protein [Nanoarchaeota archaeon]
MKKDKSPQGFIDEDIKHLLDLINSAGGYETTSSCSGRITLLNRQGKKETEWLFKSHYAVKASEVWDALQKTEGKVWFMQEPVIIHVRCDSIEKAETLLEIARAVGMKHSGIVTLGNEPVLEIRGSERVETIVEKSAVSREYVEMLVAEANEKLLRTKEKVKKLEDAVKSMEKA